MSEKILLDAPNVGEMEKRCLGKAIDSGYLSTIGPFVKEFEGAFARYVRVKRAVSTQSGTAALHIALAELGIGKGDEVIAPSLTFIASINPIMYVGAKPVFVDVDPHTWNIDPDEIEKSITKRTRAIMPVHLYGNPCAMDRIMRIARSKGLRVIEDATESLGARFKGAHVGTFGDFGCFSFNGNKVTTTGGGGMVVGRDLNRLSHIRSLVNQARDESREYYFPEVGYNYRMTNIEAAIGLAQLRRLGDFVRRKRLFSRIYREELGGLEHISFQEPYDGAESSCWFTCISFSGRIDVAKLRSVLAREGVPSRRLFAPVTDFPPYKAYKRRLKKTELLYQKGLCLPCSTKNSEKDIYRVCAAIRKAVAGI
jgi:perosamine synthetase